MTIVSQQILRDAPQVDGRRYLAYEFTDHLGTATTLGPMLVPAAFDADADLLAKIPSVEQQLADVEVNTAVNLTYQGINPDKVAEHQAQSDFDRRVLGRMMLIGDAHAFYAAYPFFQAVEGRGGANTNARAAYLGLTRNEYLPVETRFNNVSGVAWFLADEKNQIWSELPEAFE